MTRTEEIRIAKRRIQSFEAKRAALEAKHPNGLERPDQLMADWYTTQVEFWQRRLAEQGAWE